MNGLAIVVRWIVRTALKGAVLLLCLSAIALKAAPHYLPPDRMETLAAALPGFWVRRMARPEPDSQAPARIPAPAPARPAASPPRTVEPAPSVWTGAPAPVAERKTLRVGQ